MATKIKRSLYIGLGGTGMNALLHTKKMFMDTYGEIPPMIGFLGIDTDGNQYKKSLPSTSGQEISLLPNEQLPIMVPDAASIYEVSRNRLTWVPTENKYALGSMQNGAGQIRSNGRFAFTVNYASVANRLSAVLDQITNAYNINNNKYELLSANTEIHIVFSICGGTGCGTFINMAYLVKRIAPMCKVRGYAVLPGVFKSMANSGMSRVAPNAYGAIKDLDYLMHFGIGATPFILEYIRDNENYDIKDRPFNSVVFIDNRNENLDTYNHIDEITEMISLALVTSAGELSTASATVGDNLEKNIAAGSMDIINKKAWAAGMGVCEILYNSSAISKLYAIQAAKRIIEKLQNSSGNIDSIVNAWIDSPEINIRENNNNDHVIDFIADKNPKHDFVLNDKANPKPEINEYVDNNRITDQQTTPKITALRDRVNKGLEVLISREINKEFGVSTAEKIIAGISAQVQIFLNEMQSEQQTLEQNLPGLRTSIDVCVEDLKQYNSKFFKKESKLEDLSSDLSQAVKNYVICNREIARRIAAISVFNSIIEKLRLVGDRVRTINSLLNTIYQNLTNESSKLHNRVGKTSKTFQIDLTCESISNVTVNQDDLNISDFISNLTNKDKIYGFAELSKEVIEDLLLIYTANINFVKEEKEKTIDQIIDQMTDEQFNHIVQLSIMKSMPLFRYDYRGYSPDEKPQDSYYVGVPDMAKSRLFKKDYFKTMLSNGSDVAFANIGVTDRIVIYRQVGVVPAYTISSINEYEGEYLQCRINCHFDANMQIRMSREDFSLNPKQESDNDMLELWVKGFIFGLIRNKDGVYQVRSNKRGDPFYDYWVAIGQYRDEAYNAFVKMKEDLLREFNETIEGIIEQKGKETIEVMLKEVKEKYFSEYSQINMTKDKLSSKGYESIKHLISEELRIVDSLVDSL